MELLLRKDEMICLDRNRRGMLVSCHGGSVWLTQAGDSRDHLLVAGRQVEISSRGRVVLTALSDCRMELSKKRQAGLCLPSHRQLTISY